MWPSSSHQDRKRLSSRVAFFRRRGQGSGIYRWRASSDKVEKVLGYHFLVGGVWGVWFGRTPNGDPLIVPRSEFY